MKHRIIISAIAATGTALPALAQAPAAAQPSIFEGPNLALGLVAVVQLAAILTVVSILRKLTQNTGYFVKMHQLRERGADKALLLVAALGASLGAHAQSASATGVDFPLFFRDQNTWLLLGLNAVLLVAFIYVTTLLRRTIAMLMPEVDQAPEAAAEVAAPSAIMHALTDAVPLDKEHEILLDHEYDGIKELDNNLPPWWVWMFYVTIVGGMVYMVWYHVLPYGMDQHQQYIAELDKAETDRLAYIAQLGETVNETNVFFLDAADDLKAGQKIYVENCQACHGADGGGGVGPNLTDKYWIHGGSIADVFKTIKYGVPQKGMIAWESQLRPKEMAQVASYIMTFAGTTPANPKEPQGELYNTGGDAPVGSEVAPAEGETESDNATEAADSQTAEKKP